MLGAYKRVNQTIQRLKEAAEFHTEVMKGYCLYYRWLTVLKDIDIASEISIKDKEMGSGEQLASDEANRREWVLFLTFYSFFWYNWKRRTLERCHHV